MADKVMVRGAAFTGLAAVTATGAGQVVQLEEPKSVFSMQTVVTGGPASISVKLQGSLDGTNWYDLATSTSTTGDAQFGVDKPSLYLRANLGTLTGGTAPTVTALVAAV